MNVSKAIKTAIKKSGESILEISASTGIAHPILYRFLTGERTLTLETAEKLVAYFKIEIRLPPKIKKTVKKKRAKRKRTAQKRASSKRP